MSVKTKKLLYIILVFFFALIMFVSIIVTVNLTGGREIGEFTGRDRKTLIWFIAFFLVDVAALFFFADKLGRLNKQNAKAKEPVQTSPYVDVLAKRGIRLFVTSCAVCLILCIFGIGIKSSGALIAVFLAACILPLILIAGSLLLYEQKQKGLEAYTAAQRQELFLAQRREVERTEKDALTKLKKLRRVITGVSVLLICLAAVISLLSKSVLNSVSACGYLYAACLMCGGLCRLFIGMPSKALDKDEAFVTREDYPRVYALAQKASEEMGCKGDIRIAFIAENNIGVARIDDVISLQIGIYLLNILDEQELYSILLHEFSHVASESGNKEEAYGRRLQSGTPQFFLSGLIDLIYRYPDFLYALQFVLYSYAVSVTREAEADKAMLKCGDKRIAASALIKVYYLDRSDWEDGSRDIESIWASEQPAESITARNLANYLSDIETRGEFWSSLIPKEIMARSATHPTLKMRLDSFDVHSYLPVALSSCAEYKEEVKKALHHYDEKALEYIRPKYAELRKRYYLDNIEKVSEWEQQGRPLTAEGYRSIVEALRSLGRFSEAEALCDRAIAELPSASSAFAAFTKAGVLLHRYDPEGIELMYKAVESNSNYIDQGLAQVGEFCCITGNEAELERYRQKALELAQKQIDEYDQMDTIKKTDRLSTEHLPDGKLEEILAYIASIDEGEEIKKIYLVRKTITGSFFTSVFIIEFRDKGETDKQCDIMDKVFNLLDTDENDWQYSLFESEDVRQAMPAVMAVEGSLVYSK